MNEALYSQIQIIGRSNPVVHQALRMAEHGQCTYEEALQMAVVQLASITESQQKTLLDFAMRQTAPIMMIKGASQ